MGAHPCNWNVALTVSQCDTWCATGKSIRPCCAVGFEFGWGVGVQGWGGGGSGRVVLIDNGRVNQSKAADALVQVKTTKFGTNVGLNILNISSRYLGGLFWSRQLRGLPSSDGYFFLTTWELSSRKKPQQNGGCYRGSGWILECFGAVQIQAQVQIL